MSRRINATWMAACWALVCGSVPAVAENFSGHSGARPYGQSTSLPMIEEAIDEDALPPLKRPYYQMPSNYSHSYAQGHAPLASQYNEGSSNPYAPAASRPGVYQPNVPRRRTAPAYAQQPAYSQPTAQQQTVRQPTPARVPRPAERSYEPAYDRGYDDRDYDGRDVQPAAYDDGYDTPVRNAAQVRPVSIPSAADAAQPTSMPYGDLQPTPSYAPQAAYGQAAYGQPSYPQAGYLPGEPGDQTIYEEPPADLRSSGTWVERGDWYTEQSFVFFIKGPPRDVALAFDNSVADPPLLALHSTKQTYEPGMRFTLGRNLGRDDLNRDHSLEFTFLGLFDWQANSTMESAVAGNMRTLLGPGGVSVPGFTNADLQQYSYQSDMNSFEINFNIRTRVGRDRMMMQPNGEWIRDMTPSKTHGFLFGFRGLVTNDYFLFHSEGADPTQNRGDYQVYAHNNLFGAQTGWMMHEHFDNWSYKFFAKVGGLYNFSDRRSIIDTIIAGVPEHSGQDLENGTLSFMGEMGLAFLYRVNCHMSFRASYDVLFLTGVTQAPDNLQISPNGFAPYNISGQALFHGASLGFEMYW